MDLTRPSPSGGVATGLLLGVIGLAAGLFVGSMFAPTVEIDFVEAVVPQSDCGCGS